jgi:hypothetical protein
MLTPRVYRENVFLRTGLAVDAGSKEIRRHRARAHAAGTLTPDVEKMLDELQRDPNRRIGQELFAPWRTNGSGPPPGMTAEECAAHDRAVEAHRTALDLELDDGDRVLRDDAWYRAITLWAPLVHQDGVWARLRDRAEAIGDPRLTAADVERLRADLPDLLLGINAQLAADGHAPARQRELMRTFAARARLGSDRVDTALTRTMQDVLDRIERACDEARDKAGATRSSGMTVVSQLDADALPALTTAREVLGDEHPAAVRVCDRAAETYRRCVVQHLNASGDVGDPAAARFLRTALDLAVSPDVTSRVQRDLDEVERAIGPVRRRATASNRSRTTVSRPGSVPQEAAPVGAPWLFIVIGTVAVVSGLGWWGGPWLALAGGLVFWFALGSLKRALGQRLDMLGRSCIGIGASHVLIGSLPWGGLWPGATADLWGMGDTGMWLVGIGVVCVIEGAVYLGAVDDRTAPAAGWAVAATLYVGALWLGGGGGWPALVMALVLALITMAAFGGAPAAALIGLLTLGWLLTVTAVGVVAGIEGIGVVPTLIIAVVALLVVVAIGRVSIARSAQFRSAQ